MIQDIISIFMEQFSFFIFCWYKLTILPPILINSLKHRQYVYPQLHNK